VPRGGDHGGPVKENNSSQGAEKGTGDSTDRRKAVDFGRYMAELERRIKRNWFPPKVPMSRRVVAKFVVSRAGTLSGLTISSSSGSASVDQAAMKAIEMAAPFAPLPEGADETVDIQFTFDYNVFGGGGHATSF
jgi:TonB family protein